MLPLMAVSLLSLPLEPPPLLTLSVVFWLLRVSLFVIPTWALSFLFLRTRSNPLTVSFESMVWLSFLLACRRELFVGDKWFLLLFYFKLFRVLLAPPIPISIWDSAELFSSQIRFLRRYGVDPPGLLDYYK